MFRFVVRHLRWLARIPLATHLFDALLLTGTALFHPETLRAIEMLEAAALRLPGVRPTRHRYGGFGFVCEGSEFAHLHGNGLLDVKLTRERAAEIVAAGRASPHHIFGPSAWVSLQLKTRDDCNVGLEILHAALAITEGKRAR
jgi:hypothetical protein